MKKNINYNNLKMLNQLKFPAEYKYWWECILIVRSTIIHINLGLNSYWSFKAFDHASGILPGVYHCVYLHLHLYFEIDFCLGFFTRDRTDFMKLSLIWAFEMLIQDCPCPQVINEFSLCYKLWFYNPFIITYTLDISNYDLIN